MPKTLKEIRAKAVETAEDVRPEDVDYVLEVLPGIIQRIRNMSPLWSDFVKKGEK